MSKRSGIFFLLLFSGLFSLRAQLMVIKGRILDSVTGEPLPAAVVKLAMTAIYAQADRNGNYSLSILRRETVSLHISQGFYQSRQVQVHYEGKDTFMLDFRLTQRVSLLDSVTVSVKTRPETLVGKPDYSIIDFDFHEDRFILLTTEKNPGVSTVRLADASGQIIKSVPVPKKAGKALKLFHDFEGFTELVCSDSIFRIDVWNNELILLPVRKHEFEKGIQPLADTARSTIYFSNAWADYPSFEYFYLHHRDSVIRLLKQIEDADLMRFYRLEYYYLPPRMQLEARRIAADLKTEPQVVAALMSGFTKSMRYDPVFAPLHIFADTICIFHHPQNRLYHYDLSHRLLDSAEISYHHPKNWREWKRQLIVDEEQKKVYGLFNRDGRQQLKLINWQTGKIENSYRLIHYSAERIRIRDGYAYYVYRPYESTQQKFLYRELIR